MLPRTLTTLVVAAALLASLTPSTAVAGRYHVYSCRTPDGEPAPADGWSGSSAPGGAYDDYATNSCGTGGALIAALGESTTHAANVDRVSWAFAVPGFATAVNANLWRAGYLHGRAGEHGTYQFWLAGPKLTNVFDECIFAIGCHLQGEPSATMVPSNEEEVPPGNLGSELFMSVSCASGMSGGECGDGFSDPNNYAAVVYLYAADITLEQTAGPTAGDVGGELATAAAVSGTSDLTFDASDPGSGVYAAVITIDGTVLQETPLDEDGGRCREVGEAGDGLPAFLYLQPCLPSLSADVALDTTRLTNGAHHLVVSVLDAAGNSATVLDRDITIANPTPPAGAPSGGGGAGGSAGGAGAVGPLNGADASASATLVVGWKGVRGPHQTTSFGRSETVEGRLTGPAGVPIGGAEIGLVSVLAFQGAAPTGLSPPRTSAEGTFSLRIPPGSSSRTLRFSYSTHVGEATAAATALLALTVKAGLRLTISPPRTSPGGRIYFNGRLLGGPVPPSGKLLVLEARSGGGRWIKFEVVRSGPRGRYHASYRFRFPGPARYQFRVLSEPEADYPYGVGASNVVAVYER